MKIIKLIKITAGKLHGWYETDLGFNIRKPLRKVEMTQLKGEVEITQMKKISLWQKILNFIKSLYGKWRRKTLQP